VRAFACACLAACAFAMGGCSSNDVSKTAQSVATSAPVLAASDMLLAIAVKARLAAADIDSASGVSVSAHNGAVVLSGTVRTKQEIPTLHDAARGVNGVRTVRVNLRVDRSKPTASDQAADLSLSARVMASVASQAGLNALSIRANAKNGVVTLDGTARTQALRSTIVDAARKTSGVRTLVERVKIAS